MEDRWAHKTVTAQLRVSYSGGSLVQGSRALSSEPDQPTQPDASSSTEMRAFPSVIHPCGNQANCRGESFINYFIAVDLIKDCCRLMKLGKRNLNVLRMF